MLTYLESLFYPYCLLKFLNNCASMCFQKFQFTRRQRKKLIYFLIFFFFMNFSYSLHEKKSIIDLLDTFFIDKFNLLLSFVY